MYYNNEIIQGNIHVFDSYDMDISPTKGDNCFLIVHHFTDKSIIDKLAKNLLQNGYKYFNIFGEQAIVWENAINSQFHDDSIRIESSKVARIEMAYNLCMMSKLHPNRTNLIISNDEYFTEYLVEDVNDISSGNSRFTVDDWAKFRAGFEFIYNGKDAIVSVFEGVILGYLGEEVEYDTIMEAFMDKIFDGKSFNQIYKTEI